MIKKIRIYLVEPKTGYIISQRDKIIRTNVYKKDWLDTSLKFIRNILYDRAPTRFNNCTIQISVEDASEQELNAQLQLYSSLDTFV